MNDLIKFAFDEKFFYSDNTVVTIISILQQLIQHSYENYQKFVAAKGSKALHDFITNKKIKETCSSSSSVLNGNSKVLDAAFGLLIATSSYKKQEKKYKH